MEDKISQSFKVQWLNSTLKFVKNDNQFSLDYPKMPMTHVEYFYNLIWQREDHIGLGFKTLYAPLWDAMNAYSIKYEFEISIHSESNNMGQLVIKKTLRSTDDDKTKAVGTEVSGAVKRDKPPEQDTIKTMPKFRSPKLEEKTFKAVTQKVSEDITQSKPTGAVAQKVSENITRSKPNGQITQKVSEDITKSKPTGAVTKKVSEDRTQSKPTGHDTVKTLPKISSPKCEKPIKPENDKTPVIQNTSLNCENSTSEMNAKSSATVKTKPKKPSKSQKYFVQTKKIIDSIAPSFFKTTFLKIYNFLDDESNASVIFSDLAPTEALFLQNFIGIYNRRAVLDIMFSPFCNELLDKMGDLFKEFDKKSKLDICVGKTDVNTSKREIMFLKVPRYTKNTTTKAKLTHPVNVQSSSNVQIDNSADKLLQALDKTSNSPTDTGTDITKSNSVTEEISEIDIEEESDFEFITTDNDTIKSLVFTRSNEKNINAENKNNISNIKNTENTHIKENKVKTIDNKETAEKCDVKNKTIDNEKSKLETDNISSKTIKKVGEERKVNVESKDTIKITVNNKKGDSEEIDKMRSVYLKDNNSSSMKKPTKNGIKFEKATDKSENESVTDKNTELAIKGINRFKKNKLLFEAMSTPLESDKAMRMMRLMGWEGGALGLRGEGIVEPIIPAINLTPGAGLGHISQKSQKKQHRKDNRLEFLHAILDLITKDDVKNELLFNTDLSKKEKRAFTEIIHLVNIQKMLNLSKKEEGELCQQIHDKMADGTVKLKMTFHCNKKITLKKTTDEEENINKKSKKQNNSDISATQSENNSKILTMPAKKTEFRILVLNKVIKFLKNDENRTLNLRFDTILFAKYRKFVFDICTSVNNREILTHKKLSYRDLVYDLYDSMTNDYFDLHYGEDFQSFIIEKVNKYPDISQANSKKKDKSKATNESKVTLNDKPIDTNKDKDISQKEKDTPNEISDKKNKEIDKRDETKDNNNNCNTNSLNTKTEVATSSSKKIKSFIILVKIAKNMTEIAICELIMKKINEEINFLPYLKNHGVQNGRLVYSCYNKKSFLWLNKILTESSVESEIQYASGDIKFILRMKMSIYMPLKKVFAILEVYNPGLNSTEWEVLSPYCGIGILLRVDYNSFEYIRNNNFRLHAGFDEIDFVIHIRKDKDA